MTLSPAPFASSLNTAIEKYMTGAKVINNLIPRVAFFHELNDRVAFTLGIWISIYFLVFGPFFKLSTPFIKNYSIWLN